MGRGRRKAFGARDKGGGTGIEPGAVGMTWGGSPRAYATTLPTSRGPEAEGGGQGYPASFQERRSSFAILIVFFLRLRNFKH